MLLLADAVLHILLLLLMPPTPSAFVFLPPPTHTHSVADATFPCLFLPSPPPTSTHPHTPHTPAYDMAKRIIHLVVKAGDVINKDPDTRDLLRCYFLPDYNVSLAEVIIPGEP